MTSNATIEHRSLCNNRKIVYRNQYFSGELLGPEVRRGPRKQSDKPHQAEMGLLYL